MLFVHYKNNYLLQFQRELLYSLEHVLNMNYYGKGETHGSGPEAGGRQLCGGARIQEIADIIGDKSLQVVRRYIHLSEPHTRGILERMVDQFLSGALLTSTLVTLASAALAQG